MFVFRTRLYLGRFTRQFFKRTIFQPLGFHAFQNHRFFTSENQVSDEEIFLNLQLAAQNGDSKAQFNLGICYLKGIGVELDETKGLSFIKLAARSGDVEALYHMGKLHLDGGKFPKNPNLAIEYLELAAHQGHTLSNYFLGKFHLNGEHVSKDLETGVKYLKKAAENKHISAASLLFNHYFAIGDNKNGIGYLTQLADAGNVNYQHLAGLFYKQPEFANAEKSRKYLEMAANSGHQEALIELGIHHAQNNETDKAFEQLKTAADSGNIDAQYALAFHYFKGDSIDKDEKQAFHYFLLAAKQGCSNSAFIVGNFYMNSSDENQAFEYFKFAADKLHPQACYNCGVLTSNRDSPLFNETESEKFMKISAFLGEQLAQQKLGWSKEASSYINELIAGKEFVPFDPTADLFNELYHYLSDFVENDQKQEWYWDLQPFAEYVSDPSASAKSKFDFVAQRASGCPISRYFLAYFYSEGYGCSPDPKASFEWFLSSADAGNFPPAQLRVGDIYHRGDIVEKSRHQAEQFYLRAAAQNYSPVYFRLGAFYLTTDLEKSFEHFNRARQEGSKDAKFICFYLLQTEKAKI